MPTAAFGDSGPPTDPASFSEDALARLISSNSELARRLAEQDERIAAKDDRIVKLLKKLSVRPEPKPRGESGKVSPAPKSRKGRAGNTRGGTSGKEHCGLGLKAWIVMMRHKGQSTAGRIAEILNDIGLDISRRSVVRIPGRGRRGRCRCAPVVRVMRRAGRKRGARAPRSRALRKGLREDSFREDRKKETSLRITA